MSADIGLRYVKMVTAIQTETGVFNLNERNFLTHRSLAQVLILSIFKLSFFVKIIIMF